MRRTRHASTWLLPWAVVSLALFLTAPADGDWLVTLRGELIETDGPWTIDGETLTYTDLEGVEHSIDVDLVDVEGSEETTAIKAGRPYVPRPKAPPTIEPAPAPAAARTVREAEEPPIILYSTRSCGYCRKANRLLTQLDADFVVKDIEKDPDAALEFREKSGGRGGVPLIDFDGKVVRGYNDRLIRKLVRKIKKNASG